MKDWGKYVRMLLVVVTASLLVELFVFNFRHWESLSYTPVHNMQFEVVERSDGKAVVELTGIHEHVYNVRVYPFGDNAHHKEGDVVSLTIGATDAANSEYLVLPQTEVVYGVPESEYVRLHLVGVSNRLQITFEGVEESALLPSCAGVNIARPLFVRPLRLLLLIIVGVLLMLFRPSSELYRQKLDLHVLWQRVLIVCVIALHVLGVGVLWRVFYRQSIEDGVTNRQYVYLAESIIEGHPWIDLEVPSAILEANNPYDYDERTRLLSAAGQNDVMDFAYHDGKLYSYFGVVPALLFYVPWQLVAGGVLRTGLLVLCLCVALVVGVFWLLYETVRRHVPNTNVGLYALLSSILVISSGFTHAIRMPNLYVVPILCALVFMCAGLSCWLRSCAWQGEEPRKRWLVTGAICMALVMGCRPQMSMITLLAFPIFWQQIRTRLFFSQRGLTNTLCVIVPFLVVGSGLMWYNAIRFGSPLDFGATYNLTGFDMTHRGFNPERFIIGFWEYLFQPLRVDVRFPYLGTIAQHFNMSTDYQGLLVNEPFVGGFFALNVVGLFVFGLWIARNNLRVDGLLGTALALTICALFMIAVDVQVVGITQRYHMDFSLMLMFAAVLVILAELHEEDDERLRRIATFVVVWLCVVTVATEALAILAKGRYRDLAAVDPKHYYQIKYQLFSILSIR